jgi:hypothetical protein
MPKPKKKKSGPSREEIDSRYVWYCSDDDTCITAGSGGLKYEGPITDHKGAVKPDGYGGYNTSFAITGASGRYHVHFSSPGHGVTTIRYKPSSGVDCNIVTLKRSGSGPAPVGSPVSLKKLLGSLTTKYPKHIALLTALAHAKAAGVPDPGAAAGTAGAGEPPEPSKAAIKHAAKRARQRAAREAAANATAGSGPSG